MIERAEWAAVAAFFDRRAATYEHGKLHPWLARQAVDTTQISAGTKVLDVATGTGLVARCVARQNLGNTVIGIDISEGMLRVAKEQMSPQQYFPLARSSAMELPFRDSSFLHVFCVASLQYLSDPDECIREWIRVSKPDGTLTITTFATDGITSQRLIRMACEKEGLAVTDPNTQWGAIQNLHAFLRRHGLTQIHVTEVEHRESLGDPEPGWRNFLESPLGTDLSSTEQSTLHEVKEHYSAMHNELKRTGVPNVRRCLIAVSTVPR